MFKKEARTYARELISEKILKQLLNRHFRSVDITPNNVIYVVLANRRGGQVVRRRSRKPKIAGSNPVRASNKGINTLLQIGL